MEDLTQAQHKAAAALYQQASASGGPEGGPTGPGTHAAVGRRTRRRPSGDVIDAEVVDDKQ